MATRMDFERVDDRGASDETPIRAPETPPTSLHNNATSSATSITDIQSPQNTHTFKLTGDLSSKPTSDLLPIDGQDMIVNNSKPAKDALVLTDEGHKHVMETAVPFSPLSKNLRFNHLQKLSISTVRKRAVVWPEPKMMERKKGRNIYVESQVQVIAMQLELGHFLNDSASGVSQVNDILEGRGYPLEAFSKMSFVGFRAAYISIDETAQESSRQRNMSTKPSNLKQPEADARSQKLSSYINITTMAADQVYYACLPRTTALRYYLVGLAHHIVQNCHKDGDAFRLGQTSTPIAKFTLDGSKNVSHFLEELNLKERCWGKLYANEVIELDALGNLSQADLEEFGLLVEDAKAICDRIKKLRLFTCEDQAIFSNGSIEQRKAFITDVVDLWSRTTGLNRLGILTHFAAEFTKVLQRHNMTSVPGFVRPRSSGQRVVHAAVIPLVLTKRKFDSTSNNDNDNDNNNNNDTVVEGVSPTKKGRLDKPSVPMRASGVSASHTNTHSSLIILRLLSLEKQLGSLDSALDAFAELAEWCGDLEVFQSGTYDDMVLRCFQLIASYTTPPTTLPLNIALGFRAILKALMMGVAQATPTTIATLIVTAYNHVEAECNDVTATTTATPTTTTTTTTTPTPTPTTTTGIPTTLPLDTADYYGSPTNANSMTPTSSKNDESKCQLRSVGSVVLGPIQLRHGTGRHMIGFTMTQAFEEILLHGPELWLCGVEYKHQGGNDMPTAAWPLDATVEVNGVNQGSSKMSPSSVGVCLKGLIKVGLNTIQIKTTECCCDIAFFTQFFTRHDNEDMRSYLQGSMANSKISSATSSPNLKSRKQSEAGGSKKPQKQKALKA